MDEFDMEAPPKNSYKDAISTLERFIIHKIEELEERIKKLENSDG